MWSYTRTTINLFLWKENWSWYYCMVKISFLQQDLGYISHLLLSNKPRKGLRRTSKWCCTFFLALTMAIPSMILIFLPLVVSISWPVVTPGLSAQELSLGILGAIAQVCEWISVLFILIYVCRNVNIKYL